MNPPLNYAGWPLAKVALDIAIQEAIRGVLEATPNFSPRIREYWLGQDPPIDIAKLASRPPWCAVFIQFCWDQAARIQGVKNPLDDVKLEAYVADYVRLARERRWIVPPSEVRPGDIVAFSFGGLRYDHIGIVRLFDPGSPTFATIEGNTPGTQTGDQTGKSLKALDGVHTKKRRIHLARPLFFRPVPAIGGTARAG